MAKKICFLIFLSWAGMAQAVAQEHYQIGPVPGWVERQEARLDAPIPHEQLYNGVYYYLVSGQKHVGENNAERYSRHVYRLTNNAAVENKSVISIDFDPTFEKVTLHQIALFRDGRLYSDQLEPSRISILSRETNLERLSYDGEKTLHLLLEGVQVGDVVDFSYTVEGYNPAFKGKFYGAFTSGWRVPIEHIYNRLTWPKHRPLRHREYNGQPAPRIQEEGDVRTYVWERHRAAPINNSDDTPGWYDPYPWIQLSEAQSWSEIVDFEYEIFGIQRPSFPELDQIVNKIKSQHEGDKPAQMIAALRYVQDEIRYVNISKGTGGYIPNSLPVILARRFGDCKDKTILLLALLRALEIEAYPVLAHTRLQNNLREYLPSSAVFDHVFVQAVLDGKEHWLEGTATHSKGDADHNQQPDYGTVLVLKPGTTDLVEMPEQDSRFLERKLTEVFDLSKGPGQSGSLTVHTQFRGSEADSLRARIAGDGMEELARNYLDYYGHYYPGISIASPLDIRETEDENLIEVTEQYILQDLWKNTDGKWTFSAHNPEVRNLLDAPNDMSQKLPWALEYPETLEVTSTILLPNSDWESRDNYSQEVSSPYFKLNFSNEWQKDRLVRIVRYETLSDHVPESGLEQFSQDIQEALDLTASDSLSLKTTPAAPAQGKSASWTGATASYSVLAILLLVLAWKRLGPLLFDTDPANRVVISLPPITERIILNHPAQSVWQKLIQFDAQPFNAKSTYYSPHDGSETPWRPEHLLAGTKQITRYARFFGLSKARILSELTFVDPGKRLQFHVPLQHSIISGPGRTIQTGIEETLELEDRNGQTILEISLAIRIEIPSRMFFRGDRFMRAYRQNARLIGYQLNKSLDLSAKR